MVSICQSWIILWTSLQIVLLSALVGEKILPASLSIRFSNFCPPTGIYIWWDRTITFRCYCSRSGKSFWCSHGTWYRFTQSFACFWFHFLAWAIASEWFSSVTCKLIPMPVWHGICRKLQTWWPMCAIFQKNFRH